MCRLSIHLAAGVLALAVGAAQAQNWPTARPVRIVNAFAPGSASDTVARMIAEDMQTVFKQPFTVENKVGAQHARGIRRLHQAPDRALAREGERGGNRAAVSA
jgi:tripartite-type tricarboxylate transporter receptor subunit TctC